MSSYTGMKTDFKPESRFPEMAETEGRDNASASLRDKHIKHSITIVNNYSPGTIQPVVTTQ